MKPMLRLLTLGAAALASLAAAPEAGAQTGRRPAGNPAEIERLERERLEREMRDRDLRERQFLLRTMRAEPEKPAPEPRLAVAQIRADFVRLQVVNNELAKAAAGGGALDLKFVARSASEMRKLAARLRDNLALPEAEGDGERAAPPPEQLKPTLTALDRTVLKFAEDLSSWGVKQVDARAASRTRRELEEIIELSGRVKKYSEKMEREQKIKN